MNRNRRHALFTGILAALFLCAALPVMALEPDLAPAPAEPTAPVSGSVAASGTASAVSVSVGETTSFAVPSNQDDPLSASEPAELPTTHAILETKPDTPPETDSEAEADTVSTWDELAHWMTTHKTTGGTVRLTAPIVCDTTYRTLFLSPTTIDLGEHSLTVTGELDLYSPYLTIKGEGGANASLRVLSGAYLGVTAQAVESDSGAPALWQGEGGIMEAEILTGDGAVHYAAQPVARMVDSLVVSVPAGADAYALLPETVFAEVFFEGIKNSKVPMSVSWDTQDETAGEAVLERRRINISGSFTQALTYGTLHCTLVFLNQPITFADVCAEKTRQTSEVWAQFTHPPLAVAMELESSFDGEFWFPLDAEIERGETTSGFIAPFCDAASATDGWNVWDTAENPLLYLRVHWLDAQNEEEAYSDIITIDSETMEVDSDIGGNRGGGTGLEPPCTLPPMTGGGEESDGEDSNAGESGNGVTGGNSSNNPDSTSAPPASVDTNVPTSVSSGTTDSSSIITKGSAPHEWVLPSSDAPLKSGEPMQTGAQDLPDAANDVNPEIAPAAVEALSPAVAQPVSSSAKTKARAAIGVLATAGVIALTMTWRRWGKKLRRSLRALRK